jgi:hypothetical protein
MIKPFEGREFSSVVDIHDPGSRATAPSTRQATFGKPATDLAIRKMLERDRP